MKKIFSIIVLLLILSVLITLSILGSCSKPLPANIVFSKEWDGNYLYFNGYKTKTNSVEKIYYLSQFYYKEKLVIIDSYIYTGYHFDYIHLIVKDQEGTNYYLRYDAKTDSVLNLIPSTSDITLKTYENYLYFLVGGQYIYICKEGVFPAVSSLPDFTEGYLIVNSSSLKFAMPDGQEFIEINESKVNYYTVYNNRIFYKTNSYNIYDIKTGIKSSFEIEGNYIRLLKNGAYITEEYNDETDETVYKLNAYDKDYNKICYEMPEGSDYYNSTIVKGKLNIVQILRKNNGIRIYNYYHINESYELLAGAVNPILPEEKEFTSSKCGIYSYSYYSMHLKTDEDGSSFRTTLFAYNNSTGENYLCFRTEQESYAQPIVVILPY